MYPEMQQRIRTEALELLAKSRNPSMAEVDSLPYLNNFVRETLRVYTPGEIPRPPQASFPRHKVS